MRNFRLSLFSYTLRRGMAKHMSDSSSGVPNLETDQIEALAKKLETENDRQKSMLLFNIMKDRHILSHSYSYKVDGTDRNVSISADAKKAILSAPTTQEKMRVLQSVIDAENAKEKKNQAQNTALQTIVIPDRATFPAIVAGQEAQAQAVEAKKLEEKTVIKTQSKREIRKVRETIDSKNYLDLLSNLNNDEALDNETRDFVSETALKNALSHATAGGKNIDAAYIRVVGTSPDWTKPQDAAKAFQESLRTSMAVIRQLTGNGNAGLDALLSGKTEAFIKNVQDRVQKNGGKPLEVKIDNPELVSTSVYNIVGAAVTAGVAILTKGAVTVGSEEHKMESDAFMKEFKAQNEGSLGTKALSVLSWVKEAYMGRKLSLTLGRERVADFVKSASTYTEQVMKLTPETKSEDIADARLKTAFQTALRTAKGAKIDIAANFESIQKALIQSYILEEGEQNKGSNYSLSLGILMLVGVHKDTIESKADKTFSSELNEAEKDLSRTTLEKSVYAKAGIKIEKKAGKWVYSVPSEIQMDGDYKKFPVHSDLPQDANGNFIFTSEKPKQISLSHDGEGYVLAFSATSAKEPAVQTITETVNLRNRKEDLASKSFSDKLYMIGHMPEFKEFTRLLGRQDFDGAKTWLQNMSKKGKYRTLAKQLLAEKTPMETWTSYMYGSNESRSKQAYTQKYADKEVRTPDTIRAEERLAKKLGISAVSREKDFRIGKTEKFVASQASSHYAGQEMTIACFATPMGGEHRLDTYDGSVNITKPVLISDASEKKSIIEAILKSTSEKSGVQKHLAKLNAFAQSKVTMDQYVSYLVSGDISKLGVPGLAVQSGKEPKVFEGRAMIAGNVCLNRLYGIVYPSFVIGGVSQEVEAPVSMDRSTVLNDQSVEVTQSALGISPLAFLRNGNGKPSGAPSTPSSSTGAGATPGNAPTNVGNAAWAGF